MYIDKRLFQSKSIIKFKFDKKAATKCWANVRIIDFKENIQKKDRLKMAKS